MEINNKVFTTFQIEDESQIFEIRKKIKNTTTGFKLTDEFEGSTNIVVTELATNLLKHTKTGGEILLRFENTDEFVSVEILAIDKGKGITNIENALTDGYSTSGSAGTGLGAVKRISSEFDIFSQLNKGAIVYSKIIKQKRNFQTVKSYSGNLILSALITAKPNEEYCGDYYKIIQSEKSVKICLLDGLGHGYSAYISAIEAAAVFDKMSDSSIQDILKAANQKMIGKRGAVISLFEFNFIDRIVRHCGIGNITAKIISEFSTDSFPAIPGFIGGGEILLKTNEIKIPENFLFIAFTDGISQQIYSKLNKDSVCDIPLDYLLKKNPLIIAAFFYRDFYKKTDDAAIIIGKGSYSVKNFGEDVWKI